MLAMYRVKIRARAQWHCGNALSPLSSPLPIARPMTSIFDQHLPRTAANFAPLSPLGFIERTAEVYPERLAIVHGSLRQTWAQTYARCRQLASACSAPASARTTPWP
jgi:hypothetical protein